MKISEKQLTTLLTDTNNLSDLIILGNKMTVITGLAKQIKENIREIYRQQSEELKEVE